MPIKPLYIQQVMGANQRSPRRSSPEASEQAVLRIDGLDDLRVHHRDAGRLAPRRWGRGRRADRAERRGEEHAAQYDGQARRARERPRASRSRAVTSRGRRPTRCSGSASLWCRAAPAVRRHHGGGEPSRGRHHHIRHRPASAARRGRGAVPPARSAPVVPGGVPLGRRGAAARDRPRVDERRGACC